MRTETVAAIYPSRRSKAKADDRRGDATATVVELLNHGELVALPTETVYGLAANALNPEAVAKIFEAKERPRFDPLIVHLPDSSWLERVAYVSTEEQKIVSELTSRFWPGPLTLILPKTELIPDIVTAGLDTIAVRLSGHPVFKEIISAFGKPLAAPSANRFGRTSPTTAQHVFDELSGRIALVVDAGATEHGLESTIVAVQNARVEILRPGPITDEDLRAIGCQPRNLSGPAADATIVRAPGQLPSHYAPKTPLRVTENAESFQPDANQRVGLLAWNATKRSNDFAETRALSGTQDLREAAANLFRYLRELDKANLDLIVAELVLEQGLGVAINDRLRRAAAK